jgi:hypothetical protein
MQRAQQNAQPDVTPNDSNKAGTGMGTLASAPPPAAEQVNHLNPGTVLKDADAHGGTSIFSDAHRSTSMFVAAQSLAAKPRCVCVRAHVLMRGHKSMATGVTTGRALTKL